MKILVKIIAVFVVIATLCSIPVLALSIDTDESYSYSHNKKVITAPISHELLMSLNAETFGISTLDGISDIFTFNNELYILDKIHNKIFVVNSDYKLTRTIGDGLGLNAPEGMFISDKGYIYVADTGNGRVLKLNVNGALQTVVGAPDPKKTLSTVEYQPSKLVVDSGERIYVLANNETNGIFQLDINGGFLGFFGSVPVVPDFMELMWRKFSTKEQLAQMLLFVPTEYSSIDIDSTGFIYTTVATNTNSEMLGFIEGGGSDTTLAPIRRLNPKNIDVLVRNGSLPPAGDYIKDTSKEDGGNASRFIDISIRNDGTYCALDSTRGRVFSYNSNGDLLYVFGNINDTKTAFERPVNLCWWNENIVVVDTGNQTIKIFSPTEYAKLIDKAISAEKIGEYETSFSYWQKLLEMHQGNDLAYLGIGKQEMRDGNYVEAMKWFKRADNATYYSKAFKLYRKEVGYEYTGIAIVVIIVFFLVITIIKHVIKKRGFVRVKKSSPVIEGIKYGFYIMRHPFDGFWDMQHEGKGKISSATCILVASVVLNLVSSFTNGYLISGRRDSSFNVLLQGVLSILVPFALWCIANWSVTSLMNGSGSFKYIYMYSCYALTPFLIAFPLLTVLSNIVSLDEKMLYNILQIAAYVLVGLLLFVGTLVVHQYLALRTVATIFVIIIAMGIIVFLIMLGTTVVQQMTDFISLLIEEISLRT